MKIVIRYYGWICVFLGLLSGGCRRQLAQEEGVYTSPKEVFFFHQEVLELSRGRFRYWFRSDVPMPNERGWPILGKYRCEGGWIKFDGPDGLPHSRFIAEVDGQLCLLRSDAEQAFREAKEIRPYGYLIRTPHTVDQIWPGDDFNLKKWETILPMLPELKRGTSPDRLSR